MVVRSAAMIVGLCGASAASAGHPELVIDGVSLAPELTAAVGARWRAPLEMGLTAGTQLELWSVAPERRFVARLKADGMPVVGEGPAALIFQTSLAAMPIEVLGGRWGAGVGFERGWLFAPIGSYCYMSCGFNGFVSASVGPAASWTFGEQGTLHVGAGIGALASEYFLETMSVPWTTGGAHADLFIHIVPRAVSARVGVETAYRAHDWGYLWQASLSATLILQWNWLVSIPAYARRDQPVGAP